MRKLNTLLIYTSALVLSAFPAFAAQTGGSYVLPEGIQFNQFSANLDINCDGPTPTVAPFGALFVRTSNSIITEQFNLIGGTATENSSDAQAKLQLSDHTVKIRSDINTSNWISVGTYEESDVQNYCAAYKIWTSTTPTTGDMPSSVLPIQADNGFIISVSRTAQASCYTFLNHTPEITITYTTNVSDGTNSTTFSTYGGSAMSKDACNNWVEAPWVSK